ncbi:MAG: hypothetical protein LBB86_00605 [Oscillospiraceae bacterium]|jgi:hypothetical protein|nr:hypothetical protein [Oscillospiraceae bacterium]
MIQFAANAPFWKGSLHLHTTRSDGLLTPEEVAELYRRAGYDFINITDHWKTSDYSSLSDGILVLSGVELDNKPPYENVHLIGVGIDPYNVAPGMLNRKFMRPQSVQDNIDALLKSGGLAALAHPAWSLNTAETVSDMDGLFALEIFNSVSGLPWNAMRQDSSYLVDVLGARGRRLPLIAVDDAHFYEGEECKGFVMVQSESCTRESLLDAMRDGKFYASQGPVIEQVDIDPERLIVMTNPASCAVFYTDAAYNSERVVQQDGGTRWVYARNPALDEQFVRCEIHDAQGRRAWTNPAAWIEE